MKLYRGIYVANGSALSEALSKDQSKKENSDLAKKIFDETTDNFKKLYGRDESWKWFLSKHKANNEFQTQEKQAHS